MKILYKIRHIRTDTVLDVLSENSKTLNCVISYVKPEFESGIFKVGVKNKVGVNTIGLSYEKI